MRNLFKRTDTIARLILLCVAIFIAIVMMCACSPQKRLNRLISNHPELIKNDTIYKNDTTVIFGATTDTVILDGVTKDTIIIREKQLTVKYYNDGTTVYIKGVCDTIIKIKKVIQTINTVTVQKLTKQQRFWFLVGENIWLIILILVAVSAILKCLLKAFAPAIKSYFRIP